MIKPIIWSSLLSFLQNVQWIVDKSMKKNVHNSFDKSFAIDLSNEHPK